MNTLNIVPPVDIKSLRSGLMSSTARLTHHKGFFSILKTVAPIALSFAAPQLSIALSITSTIGKIAVGAALGAAGSAISGGNILQGAALGGLGAGVSSFLKAAPVNTGAAGTANVGSLGGVGVSPGVIGVGGTGLPPAVGSGVSAGSNILGSNFGSGLDKFSNFANPVSGGSGGAFANAANPPIAGFANLAPSFDVLSNAAPATAATAASGGGFSFGVSPDPSAGFVAPTMTTLAAPPSSLFSRIGANISKSLTNFPNNLSDTAKAGLTKGITQFASNIFAPVPDPGLDPRATQLLAQQQQARGLQQSLLDQRIAAANEFKRQASNISPTDAGLAALTAGQNRLGRAQHGVLRGLTGSARSDTQRRFALDKSRLGGFSRGFAKGRADRLALLQLASSALPTGSTLANSFSSDLQMADNRAEAERRRKQRENQNVAGIIGPLVFGGLGGTSSRNGATA